ncbi:uncharacterized protein LOC62_04G006495 [Vanrija pseudolonga]|uniref:Uncharacterized protein n=1 Tax=Vanrija pseudolonga TaxID=143232 RepID=A0AAF0YAE7_9TREE|nr:hypothetical protein LOC62_04G006495 [Vanrija pseudolonga]
MSTSPSSPAPTPTNPTANTMTATPRQPRPLAPPAPRDLRLPSTSGNISEEASRSPAAPPAPGTVSPSKTPTKAAPRPLAPPTPRPRAPANQVRYAAYHCDLVTQLAAAGLLGWFSPDAVGPPSGSVSDALAVLARVVAKHYPMIDWPEKICTPDGDVFFGDYMEVLDELIGTPYNMTTSTIPTGSNSEETTGPATLNSLQLHDQGVRVTRTRSETLLRYGNPSPLAPPKPRTPLQTSHTEPELRPSTPEAAPQAVIEALVNSLEAHAE